MFIFLTKGKVRCGGTMIKGSVKIDFTVAIMHGDWLDCLRCHAIIIIVEEIGIKNGNLGFGYKSNRSRRLHVIMFIRA